MASEQSKSSSSPQEGVQPPPVAHYPPQYNGQYLPPPGAFPPYYTYASIQDGSHDPNAPNGAPPIPQYVMAAFPPPPPGMVYAYPAPHPGQAYPAFAAGLPPPAPTARPKRKQVKMACTNCASACKRCDEARPCERCIKYGISDTCVDGVRKERKKGIKRGPYKRKNRASGGETPSPGFSPPGDAEQQPPPAPYPIQTEGYYPYFYPPPPPGYGPPPPAPDGQAHPEGAPNGTAPPIPHPPYYPVHPAVYAPYGPYPGAAPIGYPPPPVPTPAPAPNAPPSSTAKADQSPAVNVATGDGASTKSKKRARAKSGDEGTRAKKAKEANGDVALGKDQRQLGGPPEHGPAFTGSEPRALVAAV